jgi:hypothetical protein
MCQISETLAASLRRTVLAVRHKNPAHKDAPPPSCIPYAKFPIVLSGGITMNRILKVVAVFSLAVPVAGMAQAADQSTQMSKQQLRDLKQNAHESTQFKQLADYYRQRETEYRAKAAEEKTEWDRRAQASNGPTLKLPNPTDSARRLYDSYFYEANHSADLASHYDQLAAQNKS